MSEDQDIDFTTLPLDDRLNHKLWKARLHAYKELEENVRKTGPNDQINKYLGNTNLIINILNDSNVIAHEQAVLAVSTYLKAVYNKNIPLSQCFGTDVTVLLESLLPALVERGISSTRKNTKVEASDVIKRLCSFDKSALTSLQVVTNLLKSKNLPKLILASLTAITEIIANFTLVNIDLAIFFELLSDVLVKHSSHADRKIRSQAMDLIVEIYDKIGRDQTLIQEILLDKLKPIQQKDLLKLFETQTGKQPDEIIAFIWDKKQEDEKVDEDGDTNMDLNITIQKTVQTNNIDAFALFKEDTILDKLPEDFNTRIHSTKWKDRVEVLQEYYDNVLIKIKKFKANDDYSTVVSIWSNIIQKDANVQAVTLASQSLKQLIEKLRTPAFSKSYVNNCYVPLLERTKEKKQSVIDSIIETLHAIIVYYNPLVTNNEDMLVDLFKYMNHKIPSIKLQSALLFNHILTNHYNAKTSKKLISKYLTAEVLPNITKIVNDTQPATRNVGFESFALVIKAFENTDDYSIVKDSFETLDNQKRKKIEELLPAVKLSSINSSNSKNELAKAPQLKSPILSNNNSFLNKSTIPSKRVATSPLRKTLDKNIKMIPNSRKSLSGRDQADQGSGNDQKRIKLELELDSLKKEKQLWLNERHDIITNLNTLQNEKLQLINENNLLKTQLKTSQTSLHEKNLQLRSKELQLNKLKDRVSQMEEKPVSSNSSSSSASSSTNFALTSSALNHGKNERSSSATLNGLSQTTHKRTGSASSEDLTHRVDLLQIDSSSNGNDTFVNEESWKRAAEVTSQLKARIERMRAKTRGMEN